MTTFITDIQPIMLTALIGIIIAYARYVNTLKTRVAVLERTIEDLLKTIDRMQERLDSHSKKQDEIHETLNDVKSDMKDMKVEIVKEMGQMASNRRAVDQPHVPCRRRGYHHQAYITQQERLSL